ncbi:DEAD/DEAH box helicase [Limobrevibacterium gyesilva]|uniref:DEAD/DEAH box helicase n=1 Tax=Limobrevibacterium gyesilva TaxID=2991712 RepID=A0AA41YM08_9PROT|nr:DEAD/DEAH box helicase [Limobrevibacterium gyesilva]MCW3476354.1 DEAD/DEAH box helicase [Limobrevibacterium gyesilva]
MPFPAINPALARALAARDYAEPTPVQEAVLQTHAAGQDLLVSAQTGSGKTVAYGLAFADTLLGEAERLQRAAEPLALVIAPTRELAMQVHAELSWLYDQAGGTVIACVGGMDARREQRALAAGCHIVVGTPGRLRDHLERGQLDTSKLRVVVLDEADEMLDLGFREDLTFILDATPAERRTLLFSATIARDIAALARQYQRHAVRIDTLVQNQPHGDIEYRALRIAPNEIEHAVVNVLRFYEVPATLVFCATRDGVRHLHASLQERGFAAVALSGELSQTDRTHALQAIRDGRARVCVATDVAARGLDLPDLGLVVHADLPTDREALLHRSGRTGRAGRKGISVLLVPYTRRRRAEQLLASAHVKAEWAGPPAAEQIRARDQDRLLQDPLLTESPSEEDLVLARTLLAGRTAEEIAAALIRLHRARLPAPEDVFDSAGMRPHAERPAAAPRERRPNAENMVRFRLSIGRRNNADPKWLLPLICRLGHVTKKDIGAIRIFDRDTLFEITEEAAARFAAAVEHSRSQEGSDQDIRIEPAGAGAPMPKPDTRPSRYQDQRPAHRPHIQRPGNGRPAKKPHRKTPRS